jgi:alkylhydroperoxidase/carboxymuconolactone decarboxylase family protein YurZ
MTDESYARGVEVYRKLGPPRATGPALPEAFRQMTMSHLFGEVWTRPGLALELRSMITIATLAALGREAQLRIHIRGALNLGVTQEQLEEIFLHIAHYAGWPAGVAANQTLAEVMAEMKEST